MFTDYSYYLNEYLCGMTAVLDEKSFLFYQRKAQQRIKQYTHGNIDESAVPDCIKLCCCELAEFLYKSEKSKPRTGVVSETTGDVSTSFKSEDYSIIVSREVCRHD
ncbi:MAG: hypothetical protein IKM66_06915 [Clostridia bacterium]|nr:hypothetical protein [Clostridia bacterium]